MSNFKHKHIISLLGVCLDNDPYFLLLELMEGGDLLSYLRANRGTDSDGVRRRGATFVYALYDVILHLSV